MSKKPPIKATCPAGCLWETVHKEDWINGTTYIEQYKDENDLYHLSTGKQYKIFGRNVSQVVLTYATDSKYNFIITHEDEYANYIVFKILDFSLNENKIKVVYEISGVRYVDEIEYNTNVLVINDVYVDNADKVLLYNDDATIIATVDGTYSKEEIETIIDEKIASSITTALGGDY